MSGTESDGELVRLNVGGSLYTTFRQTLLREENTFFTELLSEGDGGDGGDGTGTGTGTGIELERYTPQVAVRLPDGSYFIDRDGQLFAYVLDYLRSGKLLFSEGFQQAAMLREEAIFYQLGELQQLLTDYLARRFRPLRSSHTTATTTTSISAVPSSALLSNGEQVVMMSAPEATGGYITLGYRGTFAFGRDGQADVKFRKLHRILVCGKVSLCREVFGDTLNESRDPDREGHERYTSRLYLKHQCLEKACDQMAEKGFKLIATCCSGANGLTTATHPLLTAQSGSATQQVGTKELMNQRNSGDFEEQRWAHYTEYIFYREPALAPLFTLAAPSSPRNSLIGLT